MENYRSVTALPELKAYLAGQAVVAFDFETAPDDAYRDEAKAALDPHKAHITGVSFSVSEGSAVYVPVAHKVGENIENEDALWAYLRESIYENNSVVKVAHNLAFEAMFLYAMGIVVKAPCYDTIAASQLTLKSKWEFRNLHDSGLKLLATSLFCADMPSFEVVTAGRHFDEMNPQEHEALCYACADSDYTLRLYFKFNSWFDRFLPQHRVVVEELESPTAVYCGLMKYNGVPIDRDLMLERQKEADEKISAIKKEIDSITGGVAIGANASTSAFKQYLYRDLGLPVMKRTEKNQEAADDAVMQLLKEWCTENRPELVRLFELVQEYRKWGKMESTYIDGYLAHVNTATGRIHPDLMPLGTETGRFACRNPNVQNLGRDENDPIGVRKFIVPPKDHLIMELDYSQMELRVGTFFCRDKTMLETYRNNGDIHASTTSIIYHIPIDAAADKSSPHYKERRAIAKGCNFGIFYGLFPNGLQRTLKFKAGLDTTFEECRTIIDNLKTGYPGLVRWQERVKASAYEACYTETLLGRRRFIWNIRSSDWKKKSFAERCALNTPIQGTAADIMKLSMARIVEEISDRKWLKPIFMVHDSLIFLLPVEKANEGAMLIKTLMEKQPFTGFDVPLVADVAMGSTYGDMQEWDV